MGSAPLMFLSFTLCEGWVVDRLNRFTIIVGLGDVEEKVYLPNPGRLKTVITPGRKVLLIKRGGVPRKTSYDAFAVHIDQLYAVIDSRFANQVFKMAVEKGLLEEFRGYVLEAMERRINGYGRIDFTLRGVDNRLAFVEVKSCTHVDNGVAKFPDRPTERGRRHVKFLSKLALKGEECHIIFIIQRPDAKTFTPYKEIDQGFADALKEAMEAGVYVTAISTRFSPPNLLYLENTKIPVEV